MKTLPAHKTNIYGWNTNFAQYVVCFVKGFLISLTALLVNFLIL